MTLKRLLRALYWASPVSRPRRTEPEFGALAHLLRRGGVAVDAGANVGTYTRVLARLVGRSGRVVAFEPDPEAWAVLRWILRLLRARNVRLEKLALSDREGRSPIWRVRDEAGKANYALSTLSPAGEGQEFVWIETITLDAYLERRPVARLDVLKIDVEGAELLALRGARASLARFRPTILIELEERHLRRFEVRVEDVKSYLAEQGYVAWTAPAAVSAYPNFWFVPAESRYALGS